MRPDERWRAGDGARLPRFAVAIVATSLLLHGIVLAVALATPRVAAVAPPEIPIEVIQAPADRTPPNEIGNAPPAELRRAPPPAPTAPTAEDQQRSALEKELAALKAEQASLATETRGLGGPLRDSIRAVALPSAAGAGGDGDPVSYQALVFSQLAKAKEGLSDTGKAGVTGVRFSLDETGGLLDLSIAVSSGNPDLDAEALAIVRRAAPFPAPPAGAEREFSANVSYASAR